MILEKCIISFSTVGAAFGCIFNCDPTFLCCNIFGNAGGDWVDCIEDQAGINGNLSEDPLFCNATSGNFYLNSESPCGPANAPTGCGLIGAMHVGCTSVPTPEGSNVQVSLEPFGYLTFETVITAGESEIYISESGPELPPLQIASEPILYYDITTTAVFSGPIEVCLNYDESSLQIDENDLILMHYEDPNWVEITTELDTNNDIICGETATLSLFIMMSSIPTGVLEGGFTPRIHQLLQNYPNPFNPLTRIQFELGEPLGASLRVYDVSGRLVRILLAGDIMGAGRHEIIWDGRDSSDRAVAAGVYFYRLTAGDYVETRRMTLIR
jgi:hypothetical protein